MVAHCSCRATIQWNMEIKTGCVIFNVIRSNIEMRNTEYLLRHSQFRSINDKECMSEFESKHLSSYFFLVFNVRKFMRTTKQFFMFIQFLFTIYLVHCQNVRLLMSDVHFFSFVLYLLLVFSMDTVISLILPFF